MKQDDLFGADKEAEKLKKIELRKQKARERSAKWRAENPERNKEMLRNHYNNNKESYKEYNSRPEVKARARTEKARAVRRTSHKIYRDNNPGLNSRNSKAYRERYPDKIKQSRRENRRVENNRRRSLQRKAAGEHNKQDIKDLMEMQAGACIYCLSDISEVFHLDHRMPLSKGGSNSVDNLQLTCSQCNLSKGHLHPDDFAKKIGIPFDFTWDNQNE